MSEILISVEKVSKWYGDVSALSEVSLEIGPGIIGLLGPNGAGKSTLLKLMSGQIMPSIGRIVTLGGDFMTNPGLFAEVGLCPEQDSLWEEMSGPAFLAAMLRLQGWLTVDAEKRAAELIGLFDLGHAGNRRVGGYSKGMRQKLRIAQAIAHYPRLLFLDEPMTGLDATSRTLVADIIRGMDNGRTAIVISTHILHEVEAVTKDMLLINQGQLRARGNVYEIRELLTDHPLQLELHVDKPRELGQALLAREHVVRVEFDIKEPQKIVVFTRHQNQFFVDLPTVLDAHNIHIERLQAEDEDMESVFKYLVH